MKVGIILPTNNQEAFQRHFLRSAHNLKPMLEEHDVELAVVTQPPFIPREIPGMTLTAIGFKAVHWIKARKETPPSMFRLRQSGANALEHCEVFVFADDNFHFSEGTPKYPRNSGERYNDALKYLEENPDCGAVACTGFLGGDVAKEKIGPVKTHYYETSKGLFFRNVGRLYTDEQLQLRGGLEELTATLNVWDRGMYVAKQYNNPTVHKDKHRWIEQGDSLHSYQVAKDNFFAWFRKEYGVEFPHKWNGQLQIGRCWLKEIEERS